MVVNGKVRAGRRSLVIELLIKEWKRVELDELTRKERKY
jgi:hypothetical protein